MEAAKEEGIRGKQFYVLAPCRVDFMSQFYWLISKTWVVATNPLCDDHAMLDHAYNDRKLSLVTRP